MKTECFFSFDCEADGPVPGLHSMLSFGAAALRGDKIVSTFTRNLELVGTEQDPDTMAFWARWPGAYAATRTNLVNPKEAFEDLCRWVKAARTPDEIPVFIAFPAGYDFSLMYYYGMNFARRSWEETFGFQALDIKTYAAATLNKMYSYSGKRYWPSSYHKHSTKKHSHVAVEDAIEQALQFSEMQKDCRRIHSQAQAYAVRATRK